MDKYRHIKTIENYNKLLNSGMFYEFHPELSGNWETDKNVILAKHPIILEELSDEELMEIVNELQKPYYEDDSILYILSEQFFGGTQLFQLQLLANKILPVVAERMRCYSPHLTSNPPPYLP